MSMLHAVQACARVSSSTDFPNVPCPSVLPSWYLPTFLTAVLLELPLDWEELFEDGAEVEEAAPPSEGWPGGSA